MTQRKLDDLFSQTSSNKRSRTHQTSTVKRDEFDDLFETHSSTKRRRTNNNQSHDVFDFTASSTTSTSTPSSSSSSFKKKRSAAILDDEDKAIDDLFNNDIRKKLRRPIKDEQTIDLLDMFQTRTTITTLDDRKLPMPSTTQKKIKMFFDDTDLVSTRESIDTDHKDYTQIKPVLITSGQWLSKEVETKSICETIEPSEIPADERNLMHIQYAPLIANDEVTSKKKSKKVSSSTSKTVLDGKSFHKQLVLSDTTILRKENLQSCYNALLEDINKSRIPSRSKSTISKFDDDEEQLVQVDFFDLPNRRKKF